MFRTFFKHTERVYICMICNTNNNELYRDPTRTCFYCQFFNGCDSKCCNVKYIKCHQCNIIYDYNALNVF